MKKSIYLLTTIFTLLFITSCSSDDDKGSVSILGKWYIHSFIYEGETELHENECATKKDQVEFKDNGSIVKYIYDEDCDLYSNQQEWSKNGNTLIIDGEEFSVIELTNSTLKLKDLGYGQETILKR